MSMSTQHGGGNSRRTSAVSTGSPGKKSAASKASPKQPAKPTKSAGKGGGPRRPITPVKVNQSRNWGPIALFVVVGLIAVGIIGYGGYYVYKGAMTWEDKANAIEGIVNWRQRDPDATKQGVHKEGKIQYTITPPVGGPHNGRWQRCLGDVYDAPIASEHAVHSMEHGAVWVTYRPDLPKDQVEQLAGKVRNQDYLLMSPFEGLDTPISLQAWGYQLKVDNASDGRIDEFLSSLKQNASMEGPTATCSQGQFVSATGTEPRPAGG
jgi:hypothetical protein